MKPEGLKPVRFPGKRDCHIPKKKGINWWENIATHISRSIRKQKMLTVEDEQEIEDLLNPFSFENYCSGCDWFDEPECPQGYQVFGHPRDVIGFGINVSG